MDYKYDTQLIDFCFNGTSISQKLRNLKGITVIIFSLFWENHICEVLSVSIELVLTTFSNAAEHWELKL